MNSLDRTASQLLYVKRPGSGEAIRHTLQHECRREYFGPPEHGHLAGGKSWIDWERSAPNAGRRLQLSSPQDQRRRRSLGRLPRSLVDMSSSAAGIPTRNRVDRSVCSLHTFQGIANPKQLTSLVPQGRYTHKMSVGRITDSRVRAPWGVADRASRDASPAPPRWNYDK
jgi:hypothetical protein